VSVFEDTGVSDSSDSDKESSLPKIINNLFKAKIKLHVFPLTLNKITCVSANPK
jgi:hypothetical protein